MDEPDLHAELREFVRRQYEPYFAYRLNQQAEISCLTDEEWWDRQIHNEVLSNPKFIAMMESHKADLVARRHDNRFTEEVGQKMIDSQVNAILPFLILVRQELNEDGPLTESQYSAASIRNSRSQMTTNLAIFRQKAAEETEPWKQDFFARFLKNVDLDIEDMKVLDNPDITEDELKDVTSKIVDRMTELTKSLPQVDD